MAKSFEAQSGKNEGSFARFYKGFNKISAAFFAGAGLITGNELFLGLAGIDIAQIYGVNRIQEWNRKRKVSKNLGRAALSH
jgi:hypothetical protein